MTPSERLYQAIRIRKALHELMTVEEADSHGGIFEHLDDFIRDITIDIEAEISPLD
tara:strand:+ start:268 stop:435 length:168 start_codon:yes stop_codon:yes gene_type:complete